MPAIPGIQSQIAARTGRTSGTIDVYANPNDFGAQIGGAIERAGAGVGNIAEALAFRQAHKRQETIANTVAQSDFTPKELEVQSQIGPDGAGLHDKTLEAYDQFVEDKANGIDDPIARSKYRLEMANERKNVSARSITKQYTLDAAYSKQNADASIMALQNKIMADPGSYDKYVTQGKAVIDTRLDIPASVREGMKLKWGQDGAKARFVGMLDSATSVEDIDRISAEIAQGPKAGGGKDDFAGKDWTKELDPQDYETLVNQMGTARREIMTKADADARAAIDTLEERAKDPSALIPDDELKATASVVKQSRNPITTSRMARIMRDEQIKSEVSKLPVAEQRARINAQKGDPRTGFPGVPPRVSTAINAATNAFDVSGSYLAQTTQREYGQYFKRAKSNADPQYAPKSIHDGVDLRNVRPDVLDAATQAGQLFGAPLPITSGYRSAEKQDALRFANGKDPNRPGIAKDSHHTSADALDISTAGMSEEDKGRLAGALVDSGFTGIGEYGTHIHADMRGAVPNSFKDDNGRTWGGWTWLSPAVAAAVKERGFAPGASSDTLKRAAPVATSDAIDYGMGTSVTKDDGRPTSSAVGVGQFTEGTWLGLMHDAATVSRMGIKTDGMTDAQLLELRKDPDIAVMGIAALAERDKRTIQNTIGRPIDDAEMYMSHFLGAGGAIALLKANDQQPEQSAAKLMPKAAAANRQVFYGKDGKELTVGQVYNNIATQFVTSPSKVQFGDVQTRQRIMDNTQKQLDDNPMGYARSSGSHDVPDFSLDNMQAYGAAVKSVSEYYNVPIANMKVLQPDDVNTLKKALDEGTADDALATLTAMQSMGGDVARAALKQLGEKDNVYAFAGGMNLDTGQTAVASDIIRGEKRMQENPDIKKQIGQDENGMATSFSLSVGNALNEVSPRVRQDVQDAALAHYVETYVARGKGGGAFDAKAYDNSVQAVLGGTREGGSSIGLVNGETTVLPPGVSAEKLETAMQHMTVADWADMSPQHEPPRYVDGTVIDPADLASEAALRAIGGGQYKLQLSDDTFAVTTSGRGGRLTAYIFQPDPEKLDKLQVQPDTSNGESAPPEGMSPDYNPLGQFDENGLWKGPPKK
jgi:uncharacterized protein YcbK (DUF882 family)